LRSNLRCLGRLCVSCHARFLAAVELDTLVQTKSKARPEMHTDVLVIGAGPTGLACAIEAQKLGLKVIVLDKDVW
jgi:NADPH-dependent 2,4-dienoyl-CoA reductase/sulfur reductase-like enzyme